MIHVAGGYVYICFNNSIHFNKEMPVQICAIHKAFMLNQYIILKGMILYIANFDIVLNWRIYHDRPITNDAWICCTENITDL